MKKYLFRSDWFIHGLHLLLALSLPLFLSVMIGCKKAKAKRADLGPEVSSDAINIELDKAASMGNKTALAVGQKLVFSDTRRLESEETATLLGDRSIEVIDAKESDDHKYTRFTLRITNSERTGDNVFETTYSEESLDVKKPTVASVEMISQNADTERTLSVASLVHSTAAATDKPDKITFHHLKVTDSEMDPPTPVKARADCGGLSPCKLPVRFLQFEMVLWHGEDYQKINFDFAFSSKTPHLPFGSTYFTAVSGILITDCRSTYVPVQGRTVYVRDCLALEDFTK